MNAFGWPRAHAAMHDAVATKPSAISATSRPAAGNLRRSPRQWCARP